MLDLVPYMLALPVMSSLSHSLRAIVSAGDGACLGATTPPSKQTFALQDWTPLGTLSGRGAPLRTATKTLSILCYRSLGGGRSVGGFLSAYSTVANNCSITITMANTRRLKSVNKSTQFGIIRTANIL
ncbi:hypothetical protein Pcac1_g7326 [Phytophthora cactorum]|nr:hypothetical protein Pcac1_g7326 [Phytophthora cactorum]